MKLFNSFMNKFLDNGKYNNNIDIFSSNLSKKNTENNNVSKTSREVWFEGVKYNLAADNEEALQVKISQIKKKANIKLKKRELDLNILNNSYTEPPKKKDNEWAQKRDVWTYEYIPA